MSETSFSILHCNFRSLNANYDKLTCMLNDSNHEFRIIDLSEIKFTQNKEVVSNIEIPNYNFIFQQSLSNSGGVGIYIRENLKFVRRHDLVLFLTFVKLCGLRLLIQNKETHYVLLYTDTPVQIF